MPSVWTPLQKNHFAFIYERTQFMIIKWNYDGTYLTKKTRYNRILKRDQAIVYHELNGYILTTYPVVGKKKKMKLSPVDLAKLEQAIKVNIKRGKKYE